MSLAGKIQALATAIGQRIKGIETALAGKQVALVSGSNLKTINGTSLLGAGDVAVSLPDVATSKSTVAPNATTPVVALLAAGAETNIDLALVPKGGSGALSRHVADGTATGGNKRGSGAVDWQAGRTSATRVASGGSATIGGGFGNEASSNYATVCGGQNNRATDNSATIAGGANNTASGVFAAVAGGWNNTASGSYATIPGGYYASTRAIIGAYAWAGCGDAAGARQTEQFVLRSNTASATPARLTTDGAAASASNGPILPNTATYHCRIRVLARNTSTGDSMSWTGSALIRREANAASTAFVGTPTLSSDYASAAMSDCVVALSVDATNGGLAVTVTGLAATSIRWVAHVETLEVTN